PTYLVLGTFLAWLAWRSGSLLPGMAAHAANNALALLQVNGLPESWWWTHVALMAPISAAVAIAGTLWLHRELEATAS
ncbi:MAG: CPBP family intramembrane metalloprotease, partial [Cyanobacteria bacterium REEB65]|nr:CPBP family intramembrane metalloprotease [Cyanobacteria bacterium REEB65]